MVKETLGDDWLTADLFRFRCEHTRQRCADADRQQVDGNYQGPTISRWPVIAQIFLNRT